MLPAVATVPVTAQAAQARAQTAWFPGNNGDHSPRPRDRPGALAHAWGAGSFLRSLMHFGGDESSRHSSSERWNHSAARGVSALLAAKHTDRNRFASADSRDGRQSESVPGLSQQRSPRMREAARAAAAAEHNRSEHGRRGLHSRNRTRSRSVGFSSAAMLGEWTRVDRNRSLDGARARNRSLAREVALSDAVPPGTGVSGASGRSRHGWKHNRSVIHNWPNNRTLHRRPALSQANASWRGRGAGLGPRADGHPRDHSRVHWPIGSVPNLLLFLADDMGYGDWPGLPGVRLSALDSLAAEGVTLRHLYSPSCICSPARGAMLTGRMAARWGGAGASWRGTAIGAGAVGGLPRHEFSIARELRAAGYLSAFVGKWHVGQRPEFMPRAHGYHSFLGIPFSTDMGTSAWQLDHSLPLPLLRNETIVAQPADIGGLTDVEVEHASDFIHHAVALSRPWHVFFSFHQPHVPNAPGKRFCNRTTRGRYGDALEEMDDAVGRVMQVVNATGQDRSTLTVFTSDNGPWREMGTASGSSGVLRGGKFTTWEGGIRVPGIAHWPGRIPAGKTLDAVMSLMDILPTIVALAGRTPRGSNLDGIDVSDLLMGTVTEAPTRCLFFFGGTPNLGCAASKHCPGLWAVRCGAYKAHFVTRAGQRVGPNVLRKPLLFQVVTDPGETHPISEKRSPTAWAALRAVNASIHALKTTLPGAPGIPQVVNQIARGYSDNATLCCSPEDVQLLRGDKLARKQQSRKYPLCSCTPENYRAAVCRPSWPPCPQKNSEAPACKNRAQQARRAELAFALRR